MRLRDGQVVLRDGTSVAYDDQGPTDAPPVLFVHAWAESLGAFDPVLSRLPPDLRVLGFDQRGHGRSDRPRSGYDLASLSADCLDFLDRRGVASAYVVGSSSGGYVAQQLAVSAPDRVRGLVLVGAPHDLEHVPAMADEVMGWTDPIPPETIRAFNAALQLKGDVPADYLEARVEDGLALPAAVWQAALRGLTKSPRPTRDGGIDRSALGLWGDDDQLLGEEQLAGLRSVLPHAEVVRYPGTGHLVLWERPDEVAADVVRFVRSREAADRSG